MLKEHSKNALVSIPFEERKMETSYSKVGTKCYLSAQKFYLVAYQQAKGTDIR